MLGGAQLLQRTTFDLTHALACDRQLPPDLLERILEAGTRLVRDQVQPADVGMPGQRRIDGVGVERPVGRGLDDGVIDPALAGLIDQPRREEGRERRME